METFHSRGRVATCVLAAAIAACGGSDDDVAKTPQGSCDALARVALPLTVLTATYSADGAATVNNNVLPAHCAVEGKTNERVGVDGKSYAIGFRLRLPDNWNGRLLFQGGGGNDGTLRQRHRPERRPDRQRWCRR